MGWSCNIVTKGSLGFVRVLVVKKRNIAIISAVVGVVVIIATIVIFAAPLPAGIYGIISVLIAAVLTAWLGPWLRENFELRRIYLAPFRKWCSELYGDLDEFDRRYLSKGINYCDYSDVQIIDDYRAVHEALIDAPIWTGKIEKEHKVFAENVKGLIDSVDKFWHYLEGEYGLQLQNRKGIICLNNDVRRKVAKEIRTHFQNKRHIYPDMSNFLGYLRNEKIP